MSYVSNDGSRLELQFAHHLCKCPQCVSHMHMHARETCANNRREHVMVTQVRQVMIIHSLVFTKVTNIYVTVHLSMENSFLTLQKKHKHG